MTLPELAAALVGGIAEDRDAPDFACPTCQPHWQDLLVHAPAACTLDGIIWVCSSCTTTGTRWEIEAKVLASAEAVRTVMDVMAEAVAP